MNGEDPRPADRRRVLIVTIVTGIVAGWIVLQLLDGARPDSRGGSISGADSLATSNSVPDLADDGTGANPQRTTATSQPAEPLDSSTRFQEKVVLPLGDMLMAEFGLEVVDNPIGVVVYANGSVEEIRSRARAFLGDNGSLSVRTVRYSNQELSEHWVEIETALHNAGLYAMGAIRPGEIHVMVSDVDKARTIVSGMKLPDDIAVTFSVGGRGEDLG